MLIGLIFNSCGTLKFNKTKEFVKFNSSISELSGKYYGNSESTKRNNNHSINILKLFNLEGEADVINLSIDQDKVKLTYLQGADNKEVVLEGKMKNKFMEIYFKKNQTVIPLLYSQIEVDRIRIGKDKEGNLVIMNYAEHSGNILFMAAGHYDELPFIFKKSDM
ncbi:hypothetical protein SAMN06296427_106197 [Moheibacter sediminis]|uniref:Uncharacterized protein n=2 Tax=Moheibacter sediminis TaxID=1434700 RepID=A0A1W2BI66_9FLAO|nr:hypothetical protein SAMN06296427_106197 [Moheibacter sediminis]